MFDVIASQVPKIPFRIMVVQILLTMAIIIAGLYCYVDGKRRDLKYPWVPMIIVILGGFVDVVSVLPTFLMYLFVRPPKREEGGYEI
jgi:hypothetical protein